MSDNLTRLKSAFKAWNDTRGASIDVWMDLIGEHCDLRSLAEGRESVEFTQHRETRDEVRGYLEGLTAAWSMIHYTPRFFIEEDDRIAVLGTTAWTNKSTGKPAETLIGTFWRFEAGKIVELVELYDTAELVRAATPD